MVLHNPNNWHWVNKDVSVWAKEWLEKELSTVEAQDGDITAKVDKIISMDGDVDVSQRKNKVITLFDVKLQLEYSGKNAEGEDVSGTITVPEVAHDTEEDEFVFDVDVYSESEKKQAVKDLVRSKLTPQLRKKLVELAPALIAEHGKDLQHAPGANPSSGFTTPQYVSSTSTPKGSDASKPASSLHTPTSNVNVVTLNDDAEFRTSADQLYQTFTDPQRVAAFTRAAPSQWEGARQGGKFELFGGNVSGEFVELAAPTRIVQKWRLAQWPAGHFSTLAIHFDQNNVDGVTVMRVNWEGVPAGQEEVTKRNWGEYYVRSIKMTFGFGTVL
ncbi:hsp90-like protein [Eremomyces bilateralis CBS 781.70]|uniref:Hsp90-like protein n=1 Tax=Eremomyces bilateralis CBS 781.70 TaxID=1392243 RepID=A0A6G1G7I5_9PEZI|nr:hsp90-like protein [Eremomyces bilateralis CBS 781.70]KAF1813972.1 hsp90-like protein [Eremomyces bilateralis CBS 781.70]